MKLKSLITGLETTEVFGSLDKEIAHVSENSKDIKGNSIFVAYKGLTTDGHLYISPAIERGATAIVHSSAIKNKDPSITYIRVKKPKEALALIASNFYGNPSKKLHLIGVTGTNGKTTTCEFIYQLLNKSGYSVGLISTVGVKYQNKEKSIGLHVTTPSAIELQKSLNEISKAGCDYAVVEVTSHGIDQKRTFGLNFDIGAITNITPEHLDYHKTMKSYIRTKAKIFEQSKHIVLNKFDPSLNVLKELSKSHPSVEICNYKKIKAPSSFVSQFSGVYNLENLSIALAVVTKITNKKRQPVSKLDPVEGRMENIKNSLGKKIIIDFAHDATSLEKVLKVLKNENKKGKLIVVFGCAGLRDTKKRPKMGKISASLADYSVITAEDPRTESLVEINASIEKGLIAAGSKRNLTHFIVPDRQAAINFAIHKLASKGDTILISGKGHEKSMCFGTTEYPWTDQEAVSRSLALDFNFRVSSDTRTLKKGDYFVPVKGENFDGGDYVNEALEKGAAGILEEKHLYSLVRQKLETYRPVVVGITGSVGKTVTKEALSSLLSEKYKVLHSEGNLNTLLGLSLEVINKLDKEHEFFVAEMGMDRLGELDEITSYIKPDIAIVTNISGVHKEKLGNLENIIKAKSEILNHLEENDIAFLNGEDKNVKKLKSVGLGKRVFFYTSKKKYKTSYKGDYSDFLVGLLNTVCSYLGFTEKEFMNGLLKLKNPMGRMSFLKGPEGCTVIDDTYNSSPVAVASGLNYLKKSPYKRKVAILGDMLELGKEELEIHKSVLKNAVCVCDEVYTVGNLMKKASVGLRISRSYLKSSDFKLSDIGDHVFDENTVIYVKGSRGMRMELIANLLTGSNISF